MERIVVYFNLIVKQQMYRKLNILLNLKTKQLVGQIKWAVCK